MEKRIMYPPLSVHSRGRKECTSLVRVTTNEPDRITLMVELIPGMRVIWSVASPSDEIKWRDDAVAEFRNAWAALETPSVYVPSSMLLPPSIEGGSPGAVVEGNNVRYSDCFSESNGVELSGHIIEIPIDRYRVIMKVCSVVIANPAVANISPHIIVAVDELKTYVSDEHLVDKIMDIMLSVAIQAEDDDCSPHEGINPLDPLANLLYIMRIVALATSYATQPDHDIICKLVAKGIAAGFGRKK